tara:strand:- start:451 stop:822 length:372 start_codon:yes stop_codon:yes gene_type:complete
MIINLKKIEDKLLEWQRGVRILFKDLQVSNELSDDKVLLEVKNELIRISNVMVGIQDLDWIKLILRLEKDITIFEAQRMYQRFKYSTFLLDVIAHPSINSCFGKFFCKKFMMRSCNSILRNKS